MDNINVGATGVTKTSGATSANVAIPNTVDGNRAKVVRLTSTALVHVKFGVDNTVAATADDLLIGPGDGVNVNCKQWAFIAYIQETASAKLNITPLEF